MILFANSIAFLCYVVRSASAITATASASASSVPSSVDNIIPIVIGTTVTIMILLITAILLLMVFLAIVCYKRDKKVNSLLCVSINKYNLIL